MGGPVYSLVRLTFNTLYPAYSSFKVLIMVFMVRVMVMVFMVSVMVMVFMVRVMVFMVRVMVILFCHGQRQVHSHSVCHGYGQGHGHSVCHVMATTVTTNVCITFFFLFKF